MPGIPLAVALPAIEMTLLEATRKKCEFLVAAVAAAGLAERVHVVCARSERYAAARPSSAAARQRPDETAVAGAGREAFAVVVARALAPLAVVVELGAPLLAPGGLLVASKTSATIERERAAGEAAAAACGLALRDSQHDRRARRCGIRPRPCSPRSIRRPSGCRAARAWPPSGRSADARQPSARPARGALLLVSGA